MRSTRITRDDTEARNKLLEQAKAFVRTNGYKGTTVRALARYLGISTSSLYYHFPNKEVILSECLLDDTRDLIADGERVAGKEDMSPGGKLEAFLRIHFDFQIEWCGEVERSKKTPHGMVSVVDGMSEESQEQMRNLQRRFLRALMNVLEEGKATGEFNIPDTRTTAFAVLSFGEHLITWYRPTGKMKPDEVTETFVMFAKRLVDAR
jgi:AcrR family transcriptional regulator